MTAVSFKEALRLGLDLRTALGFEGAPKAHQLITYTSDTRISFRGQQLTISEWSKLTGIPIDPLKERLRQGWPIERALTEPVVSNVERALRARNRRVISRIAKTFTAPPATGGYQATSADSAGTGVGSALLDRGHSDDPIETEKVNP